MSLGLKSGRKQLRDKVDRITPVPEDEIGPIRSRSSSAGGMFRRVRSMRERDGPMSAKEREMVLHRTQSPEPDLHLNKRSSSAVTSVSRGYGKSSSKGASGRRGGDRSISSSPHRGKLRGPDSLRVPDTVGRPMSPGGTRPVKSSMKKGHASVPVTSSPTPMRSRSTEKRTGYSNVFDRLYPGSSNHHGDVDEGISDSRFAGVNDTLRIRKKKDVNKSSMVDFDGTAANIQAPGRIEHNFVEFIVSGPIWCDRCGAFIWGLYKRAFKCDKCNLTCHKKCAEGIDLECNAQEFEELSKKASTPTKEGNFSELVDSVTVTKIRQKKGAVQINDGNTNSEERHALQLKIITYNNRQTPAHQLKLVDSSGSVDYQGFVRVHMCVTRPIHVSAGVTKNSWYGLMKPVRGKPKKRGKLGKNKHSKVADSGIGGSNETTFYLPTDANRLVHISNSTTTLELISILLKKFCVTDHPNKFALFEEHQTDTRRLFNEEHPLKILVDSTEEDRFSKLVLRDNTDGSIQWTGFSYPELSNFVQMLGREEELHIKELKGKFTTWKRILMEVMREKCLEEAEKSDRALQGPNKSIPAAS